MKLYVRIACIWSIFLGIYHETPAQQRIVRDRVQGYRIGDVVADFTLKNVNGEQVNLAGYASKQGVIILFTSTHCPFAKSYEDRFLALDKKFSARNFPVIAINPNDPGSYEDDTFEQMKERAKTKGYTYPYLSDDNQQVAKAFGANRTPEVFVLRNNQGKFVLAYSGSPDDNPQDENGVSRRYVEDAVTNLLDGKPVATTRTRAIGCPIKWKEK